MTIGTRRSRCSVLARRFSSTSENLGTDQEEKKTRPKQCSSSFGDEAVEPLKRYMREYDKVTWAIDALQRSSFRTRTLIPFLFEILAEGDPVRIRGDKATQTLESARTDRTTRPWSQRASYRVSRAPTTRSASPRCECIEAYADEQAPVSPSSKRSSSPDEDSIRVKHEDRPKRSKNSSWDVKGYRKKGGSKARSPSRFRVTSKGRVAR